MPLEYIDDRLEQLDREPVDMTIGDVQLRGIYEVEERGAGFHEEYKAERERESGGQAEVDEPPAAEVTVQAYGEADDWAAINELRKQREPFPVSIGPIAYAEMGITDASATESSVHPEVKEITVKLQEFREVIVQRQSIDEVLGGGGGGTAPGEPTGPTGWDPGEGPEVKNVTVPSGSTRTFQVGAGETWGRRIIDQSSGGANAHVNTQGGGWTIQDVGLTGTFDGRALSEGDVFIHARTSNGNASTIQNVYMGDGSSKARDTGIYLNPSSTGGLTVQFTNAQHWRDNAMYLSAPHESGGNNPPILIEHCFAYNNETSSYRMGRGTIRGCVGHHDSSHSGRGNRTVWARPPGDVVLEDCDLLNTNGSVITAGAQSKASSVSIKNTRYSGNINRRHGSTVSGSSAGEPDVNNYHENVPGRPQDAGTQEGQQGAGEGGERV